MKRLVAMLLAVLTLVACIPMTVSATEAPIIPETGMPFKDVKTSHWFYDAVKYTYDKGIFAANNTGSEADFEAFKALNLEYADYMSTLGHHQFSLPSNWTVDGNPDLWQDDSE